MHQTIVALGLLFGPLRVLFGAPLAVVRFVLARESYVKRTERFFRAIDRAVIEHHFASHPACR